MNTVNITYLETIYKGCAPDGTKTDPSRSDIVRLCHHTAHSHATLMAMLSPAFLNAQQIADEKVSNKPYHISIIWTLSLHEKRKHENAETAYDTLKYFLNHMMTPTNGVIISIYHAKEGLPHLTSIYKHAQIWPFEKQWNPQGTYVSVHKHEPLMSKNRIKGVQEHEKLCLPIIEQCAEKYGYDIKYVDYTLTTQEIVDIMTSADQHFCYSGATYYTACMIGVPALAWHHYKKFEINWNELSYTDIDPEKKTALIRSVQTLGTMSTNAAHIRQYDFKNKCVNVHPYVNQQHIMRLGEIEEAFLRMIK